MTRFSRAVASQLAGLTLLGLAVIALARLFPVVEWITQMQQRLAAMQFWGALLYPLLFAACNVLLLPGGVVAMGGGLFFGLWWGTALVLSGNLIGAAFAFGVSRCLGRAWLERKFYHSRRWRALDAAIGRQGWKIIFLSQVHPLFPTSLLNYLYGVTRIRFWPCMAWIALGQLPGLFLYAYLGTLAQLGIKLVNGKTHPFLREYGVWFGGLFLTVAVTTALGRVALRLLAEVDAETADSASSGSQKQASSL
ncbi:MAG: TVP38/TMEM64 family protein [Chthoniobacteraceae bacterium]|nr:TVP38/TMEM64 family protein [Chthoniobacteraceae bacterium]